MAARAYHHGDLRTALIDAGLGAIELRGSDDLSLRELARAVGVSATAVYRHFPHKKALMAALAEVGLERLAESQRRASVAAGGGEAGFKATGAAYVRFALANPGLFRLIFATPQASPVTMDGPDAAMSMLREARSRIECALGVRQEGRDGASQHLGRPAPDTQNTVTMR